MNRTLKLLLSILIAANTLAVTIGGLWFEWNRRQLWNYSSDIDTRAKLPPTTLWSD